MVFSDKCMHVCINIECNSVLSLLFEEKVDFRLDWGG